MSSLERTRKLTGKQKQTVKEASRRLTHEQKKQIQHRQEKIQVRQNESMSSRGEGPSQPKGKAIDLREWGNTNLSTESLDIEAQMAAFNSIKTRDQSHKHPKRQSSHDREGVSDYHHSCHSKHRAKSPAKRTYRNKCSAASQPAAQIAPKSYLGTALKNVA